MNVMLQIYNLSGEITDAANAQVTWLSNFAERNLDCKMLKYKRYNGFLNALDSAGRVREMLSEHHSAQQRKTRARKKLGDLWQHHLELQEILNDTSERGELIRLTTMDNQISRDSRLVKRCLNCASINRIANQTGKLAGKKWYTSDHFQEGNKL
jgi:hypothetical protein